MKQQRQPRISIGWLVATAIVLASAGSFAEDMGNVQSGGSSVNEVYGRASATIPGANPVRSISSKVNVSEVFGRGSGIKTDGFGATVATGKAGVNDVLGRSSGGPTFATAKSRSDNQTAAMHRYRTSCKLPARLSGFPIGSGADAHRSRWLWVQGTQSLRRVCQPETPSLPDRSTHRRSGGTATDNTLRLSCQRIALGVCHCSGKRGNKS